MKNKPHCQNNSKQTKSIPLTHICITAHSPDLIQALQYKVAGLK